MRFLLPNVDHSHRSDYAFITAAEAKLPRCTPQSARLQQVDGLLAECSGVSHAGTPIPADQGDCSGWSCPALTAGVPIPCCRNVHQLRRRRWLGSTFWRSVWTRNWATTTISSVATSWITDCSRLISIRSIRCSTPTRCSLLGIPRCPETHVFSPTKTNQFTATLSHYVAISRSATAASTFNYGEAFNEISSPTTSPARTPARESFPQGRNITQYQFIDDFSWTHGNHTFKFGENFRRYDISDHNFFFNSPVVYWGYGATTLQQFAEGEAFQYRKAFITHQQRPDRFLGHWRIRTR